MEDPVGSYFKTIKGLDFLDFAIAVGSCQATACFPPYLADLLQRRPQKSYDPLCLASDRHHGSE